MTPPPAEHKESFFEGLHVLVDDDPRWRWAPLEQTRFACSGGASVIQLRSKFLTDQEVVELGYRIREQTREAGIQFVMNDRFDLALACEADAVHLGHLLLVAGLADGGLGSKHTCISKPAISDKTRKSCFSIAARNVFCHCICEVFKP